MRIYMHTHIKYIHIYNTHAHLHAYTYQIDTYIQHTCAFTCIHNTKAYRHTTTHMRIYIHTKLKYIHTHNNTNGHLHAYKIQRGIYTQQHTCAFTNLVNTNAHTNTTTHMRIYMHIQYNY
jgi:hypothetical protein